MILTIDSTGKVADDFTTQFSPLLELSDKDDGLEWHIALYSLKYVYNMRNIDSSYSNNTFEYYNGSAWKTVTLPGGIYGVEGINELFQQTMKDNGDYTTSNGEDTYYADFTLNYNTLTVKITLSNSYQVRFTNGSSFRNLIGADATTYNTTTMLTGAPDINRGITSFNIHLDYIEGNVYNGSTSDIIYNFIPNVPPGTTTEVAPLKHLWMKLTNKRINKLRVHFTDQMNRPISFFGETVTLIFVLERR